MRKGIAMLVYLLSHSRQVECDAISSVIIGIYSSMSIVNMTIEKYKNIVGFKDYPNDFDVEDFEVISCKNEGIVKDNSVYLLQHEYSVDEYEIILLR